MTTEQQQRQFFEKLAGRYDNRFFRSRWPRNQQLKACVIADVVGAAGLEGAVIELGCGTAQIARDLLDRYPRLRYVGLDLSSSMLEIAGRRLDGCDDRAVLRQVRGTLP
jgi:ubiquinone/menaquinone biosynthesis C-methylase UbiE